MRTAACFASLLAVLLHCLPLLLPTPPPNTPFSPARPHLPTRRTRLPASAATSPSPTCPAPRPSNPSTTAPTSVPRPANAWPIAPKGFKVELYATGLDNPRLLRFAPNGDLFLAESQTGKIRVFRGVGADGKPKEAQSSPRA